VEDRSAVAPRHGAVEVTAPGSLWFNDPDADDQGRSRTLTRQQVVREALMLIAQDGLPALTMRNLAARLGVVPGALYRHIRGKERLQDLILDSVVAEVDRTVEPHLRWTEQIKELADRLRNVLAGHPGVAALLKTRDPLGPHSLALAEAFLQPLHAAGFSRHEAGLAFFLILDYTIGFEVSNTRISDNEQRVQDPATRQRLHEFFRSLPRDRFPTLSSVGEYTWLDNRDERFTSGLNTILRGLESANTTTH